MEIKTKKDLKSLILLMKETETNEIQVGNIKIVIYQHKPTQPIEIKQETSKKTKTADEELLFFHENF